MIELTAEAIFGALLFANLVILLVLLWKKIFKGKRGRKDRRLLK